MNQKAYLIFLFLLLSISSFGQDKNKILNEGKMLFRLEKASWYGTDDFLSRFPDKRDSIGGYFSYFGEDHSVVNIFYSKNDLSRILVRYYFDSIPQTFPFYIDTANNKATISEMELISIREDALMRVRKNEGNSFTFYKNTSFNLIPLITRDERKVIIITGPQTTNTVIIGNDYLLKYNKHNKFKSMEKIHKSMLQYPFKSDKTEDKLMTTFHSHVMSDLISPTDICTLLLYKEFVEWNQHIVLSEKYVSIFNLEKEQLDVISRKAWDKIYNQKEIRK
jgi:hypothetical protein